MRFKTDENLPASVVNVLRNAGHDVHTVVDERLAGATDDVVLAAATQEQRAFLTLDKDFADIRAYPPADYAGIVVLRAGDQSAANIRALVSRLLPLIQAGGLTGKLWIVDTRRVRVR
jgi:predicted nuclease of predicted toxin-antitoxin system